MKILPFILLIHLISTPPIQAQYDSFPEPNLNEAVGLPPYVNDLLPYLGSCENNTDTYQDKKDASDKKLLDYIYKTLRYPDSAMTNQIEGLVVVSFLVKKDGWIEPQSIQILRDIGYGCGEEALRIIQSLNRELGRWAFHATPLDVRFSIPIRFRIY